jgi:hypothetical protein
MVMGDSSKLRREETRKRLLYCEKASVPLGPLALSRGEDRSQSFVLRNPIDDRRSF